MAIVYKEEVETRLQERLTNPSLWKEVCKVSYTDVGILNNPYLTDSTQYTGTRGTGYDSVAVATVNDSISITGYIGSAQHIDRADLAQKSFSDWMEIADNMATVLDEGMETQMLAEHAQWTDFDATKIGLAAGNITVAITNIKKIIAAMKTQVRLAKGKTLAKRNGLFIVWREADFELVELLASSEGFNTADDALKNGIKQGFEYLGVEHYSSTFHTAGHVFGGVKKAFNVGVVKSTYGLITEVQNPVVSQKQISGIGLETRIDSKYKAWTKMVPVLFDILVA
jgi:hypothetical protein